MYELTQDEIDEVSGALNGYQAAGLALMVGAGFALGAGIVGLGVAGAAFGVGGGFFAWGTLHEVYF